MLTGEKYCLYCRSNSHPQGSGRVRRDKVWLDRQVGSGVKVEVQGDEMGRMMERWWHGKIGILMK